MHSQRNQNGGFIRFIILIIVVLVVLSYLGIDVKKIIYSPAVVQIASLVWGIVVALFNLLIKTIGVSWTTIVGVLQFLVKFIQNLKPPSA